MSWFDDFDAQNPQLSPAEQTYANQTAAREQYYNANPSEQPVFAPDQQAYLDTLTPPAPPVAGQQAPAPPPAQAPAYGGGAAYNAPGGLQQQFWALFPEITPGVDRPGNQLTAEMIRAKAGELQRLGISLVPGTSGDAVRLPDGTVIDVIGDAGGRNVPVWQDPRFSDRGEAVTPGQGGGYGAGGGGTLAGLAAAGQGVQPPSISSSTFRASTAPLEVPAFTEPFNYKPWERRFEAPTAESVLGDQGFQARLKAGQQALERSASSRGSLNTGGTLRDVLGYGQELASNEYEQAYGRKAREYQSDYGDYLGGYERALGEYGQRAGIFGQNYQRGLQGFQSAQQAQEQQFGQGFRNRELGQRESEFGRNLGYNYANLGQQGLQFGQRLGYDYDQLYTGAALGGTGAANQEYTAGANAQSVGQEGSATALNQAIGSGADYLTLLGLSNAGSQRYNPLLRR